jgi:predicted permease
MISAKGIFLASLVATMGIAAISAWVIVASINEGDAGSAWVWAALFVMTFLMAAWCFWRLV